MIEVEGISKSFGETRALAGVDMSVPAGTVQGLLGPNGAASGQRHSSKVTARWSRPSAKARR
jgi:ABC-2 type transport system ATP-binding protein